MNRLVNVVTKMWMNRSRYVRSSRPKARTILQLESLDGRIVPAALGITSSGVGTLLGGSTPVLSAPYNPPAIAPTVVAPDLMPAFIGNFQIGGHTMWIEGAARRPDGSWTFFGEIFNRNEWVPVQGVISPFQSGGPAGFEAKMTFNGTDTTTGETFNYEGSFYINCKHAMTEGTLVDSLGSNVVNSMHVNVAFY